MSPLNIYLCGVGGQGIGLLSEVLGQACLAAGHVVRGCDTHGLAQRGGTVVSHVRLGAHAFAPRVPPGRADLVIGLERIEALRATLEMLQPGGAVLYYDTVHQPASVRTREAKEPSADDLAHAVAERNGRVERVFLDDLPDPRSQNVALLGCLGAVGLVEGVGLAQIEQALRDTLPAAALEANLGVLAAGAGGARR